jgi:hypothetical protein
MKIKNMRYFSLNLLQHLRKGIKRTYFSVIFSMPLSPYERNIMTIQIFYQQNYYETYLCAELAYI